MSNKAVAPAQETSREKAMRIRKARAKKENSLPLKIQESDLYDWDSTARFLLVVIAFGQRTSETAWTPDDSPYTKEDYLGWCDMAQWRLAQRIGKSVSQVQRLIRRFEDDGVLLVRRWEDDNHTSHNMYQVIEKVVDARQRPSHKPDTPRGKRYKKERPTKGWFSSTNQPGRNREVLEMDEE
jgi:hypothetical protein